MERFLYDLKIQGEAHPRSPLSVAFLNSCVLVACPLKDFCDRETVVKESVRFRHRKSDGKATSSAEAADEKSFSQAINGTTETTENVPIHVERPLDHPHVSHGLPISKLYIFDFDSTLFRSPLPNPNLWAPEVLGTLISDCGWFVEPRTLRDPYIPASPDPSWWDLDVVKEVREAMRSASEQGDSIVTLLTGRRHDLFADRIRELCHAFDPDEPLKFD
ncbi:hypothetical protein HDU67_009655, partial [Dinochytrium kinnereticum]